MKSIINLILITAALFMFSNNSTAQTPNTVATIKTKIYCHH